MKVGHLLHIKAPPATVWQVATDIDNWPEWTPTVDDAKRLDQGPFRIGSSAVMKQPGLPEATWIVTELTDGKRFVWESRLHGLFVRATHEVATATDGGADSQLYFEAPGIVGRLLSPFISGTVLQAIERENNGLKAYCEKMAASAAD